MLYDPFFVGNENTIHINTNTSLMRCAPSTKHLPPTRTNHSISPKVVTINSHTASDSCCSQRILQTLSYTVGWALGLCESPTSWGFFWILRENFAVSAFCFGEWPLNHRQLHPGNLWSMFLGKPQTTQDSRRANMISTLIHPLGSHSARRTRLWQPRVFCRRTGNRTVSIV